MKALFVSILLVILSTVAASAQPNQPWPGPDTTRVWTSGWDIFNEPLNYNASGIAYSTSSTTHSLTINYVLVGATPNKLYQVGMHIFCTSFPTTFGQFPTHTGGGPCGMITRQGVTRGVVSVELGVVTTDIHGNGSFKVVVGPITPGTYHLEFSARNGAGCNLIGGADCSSGSIDFQSPGPIFGMTAKIVIL